MSGKVSRTFRPSAKAHARYAELLPIYAELWPLVSRWNRRLQKFAGNAA
jgi:hypothetical protein